MGPDKDIRSGAGCSGLLEFVGDRFRVLHNNFNAKLCGEFVAQSLQAVIALVAIDSDEKLTIFKSGAD